MVASAFLGWPDLTNKTPKLKKPDRTRKTERIVWTKVLRKKTFEHKFFPSTSKVKVFLRLKNSFKIASKSFWGLVQQYKNKHYFIILGRADPRIGECRLSWVVFLFKQNADLILTSRLASFAPNTQAYSCWEPVAKRRICQTGTPPLVFAVAIAESY